MNAWKMLAAATVGLGTLVPAAASAQLFPTQPNGTVIFFDYFLFDNGGLPQQNLRTFLQWTVTNGSVDLIGGVGPGVFFAPPIETNGRYVDLGGSTGAPGLFETTAALPLLQGATYGLSFLYRSDTAGQTNSATASFAGNTFDVATSSGDFQFFNREFVVGSGLTSRLAFQGLRTDTDNSGIGIDAVLLRVVRLADGTLPTNPGLPVNGAVPEPSTWALLIAGFGAIGATMRRRAKGLVRAA